MCCRRPSAGSPDRIMWRASPRRERAASGRRSAAPVLPRCHTPPAADARSSFRRARCGMIPAFRPRSRPAGNPARARSPPPSICPPPTSLGKNIGTTTMSRFWSRLTHDLKPYVPGEQPRMSDLVKLNTNESPYPPSPRALEAIRGEATDTLRLYPDPQASALRAALAAYHQVQPEQVFVGNGSDEVLAHALSALLKHDAPLLFPDITYSFYPVYCRLFGIACETLPLDRAMRIRVSDYRRRAGAIILPNPNAPTGVALLRAEIAT